MARSNILWRTVLPWLECERPRWVLEIWKEVAHMLAIREFDEDTFPLPQGMIPVGANMACRLPEGKLLNLMLTLVGCKINNSVGKNRDGLATWKTWDTKGHGSLKQNCVTTYHMNALRKLTSEVGIAEQELDLQELKRENRAESGQAIPDGP